MEEIKYVVKLSKELSEKEIDDFLHVFNDVFYADHDREWFDWKYLDNIYGDSYIVIAYSGEDVAGVRSFWRNDIGDTIAYQPCDTAVSSDFRKRGIFSKMTEKALSEINEKMIYNYPNENSYPGYIKLGWEIKDYFYLKLVTSKKSLRKETSMIPGDYLKWKFINSPLSKYSYYKHKEDYYLLFKRNSKLFYVLGRFDKEYKDLLEEAKRPILFNYTKEETLMYKFLKNRARIVTYDKDKKFKELDVPIYKGDFF